MRIEKSQPKLRLRLMVGLPVILSLFMMSIGILFYNTYIKYLMPKDLPFAASEKVILSWMLFMTFLAFIGGLATAYIIVRRVKRSIEKVESLIGSESKPVIVAPNAVSELDALGIMLDEAKISLSKFIDDSYILENLPEAVLTLDSGGEILSLNRQAANLLKINIWEGKGKNITEYIPRGSVSQPFYSLFQQGVEGVRIAPTQVTIPVAQNAPELFWISIDPIEDREGFPKTVSITFKDLNSIVAIRNQILKVERLAVLGQFVSCVAHEVRNPLASIRMFAQMTGEDIPQDDPKKMYMDQIVDQVDRLDYFVEDILTISRDSICHNEVLDVGSVISHAAALARDSLNGDFVILADYPARLPKVSGDYGKLCQAFMNIIRNALEAGSKNIAMKGYQLDELKDSKYVYIDISDDGEGMTQEVLGKLFEPFYTKKSNGTGLGLSITQNIIDAHGGYIQVQSRVGEGTTFCIALPKSMLCSDAKDGV